MCIQAYPVTLSPHQRVENVYRAIACFRGLLLEQLKEDYNFKPTPLAWDESSPSAHWDLLPQEIKFFSVFNYFGTHESRIWNTVEAPQADFLDVPIPKLLPEHPEVRKDVHQNYCNLERLDDWVGHHVGRLKEEGIYDQTMIVFFSDPGGHFHVTNETFQMQDCVFHLS